jgi:hypothetical protein
MIAYPFASLFVAAMFGIAAVAVILRCWLYSESGKHPDARTLKRVTEWVVGMAYTYGCLWYLSVFIWGKPDTVPPQPDPILQVFATILAAREVIRFFDLLGQRLPRSEWDMSKVVDWSHP